VNGEGEECVNGENTIDLVWLSWISWWNYRRVSPWVSLVFSICLML